MTQEGVSPVQDANLDRALDLIDADQHRQTDHHNSCIMTTNSLELYSNPDRACSKAETASGPTEFSPCRRHFRAPRCQIEAIIDAVDAMSPEATEAHLASLTKEDLWAMIEVLAEMSFGRAEL
jgi:hypothetical protein